MSAARIACLAVACWTGCVDSTVCGEGTHLEADECRASLSPQCGLGTRLEEGACVPDEGGGAMCGSGTHLEGTTCVADVGVAGNAGRFYDVSLTAPSTFVNVASGPLRESFRTGENLAFIAVHEPRQGDVRIFGGGGTRNGTWYVLDRTESFEARVTFAGDRFASEPFTFNLRALGAAEPIRLVQTVIDNGVITRADGAARVDEARLSGVLTPEAADAVYIEPANQTLLQLTQSLRVPPDVDLDGNGTAESWTWALQLSTTPVWLF